MRDLYQICVIVIDRNCLVKEFVLDQMLTEIVQLTILLIYKNIIFIIFIIDEKDILSIIIADYDKFKQHPTEYAESLFQKIDFLITYYDTIILNLEDINKNFDKTIKLNGVDITIDSKVNKTKINELFTTQIKYIMTQINTNLPATISNIVNNKFLDLIFNSEKLPEEKCKFLIRLKNDIEPPIFNTFMNSQLSLNRKQRNARLIQLAPLTVRPKKNYTVSIVFLFYFILYIINNNL